MKVARPGQKWLVRFVEHRIGDKRIIRLIRKWLKAGILEDGIVTVDDRGTGQGSVISPLLPNIYLHYVFDLWAQRWRQREATGDMIIVRFHHINVDALRTAFYALRRKAAPGVDGMTWQDYESDLELRLEDLHKRVQRGTYHPQPSRRTFIPKADGKQRPLAIPTRRAYCTSCSLPWG